ncbi:MAG TPA: MraY family glycosyltransferase [Bacteroidales bacterium]|nr:MraY family glycosyltransferase [Bacteroidales bacterium]HOK98744.1 MraY family glycosyltransferase [Bacteroidales bacterium]HPO66200.1 MraY family glycosyltransferase [Bacteroidales bacterium]
MLFDQRLVILLSFLTAFFIVLTSIPTIVKVAHAKRLTDEPGKRKSHSTSVPTLGGIAIFTGILIPFTLYTYFFRHFEFQYIIAASLILFFVGVKDDILVTAPLKKLMGQVIASLIIIVMGDFRFTSLHGFYGIYHIPYWASIGLTLFVFLAIINGFNLIDGIDGLASGVGIVATLFFGTWFFLAGSIAYAILAAAVMGSLLTFFGFNVFGRKNKIFMGDTGSLIIGLFMAVFAVKFNEMNTNPDIPYFIHAAPAVSFGILIVPLFDTLRVMIIRLVKGRSLFKPDKNHVHHKLLSMGFSHFQSTLLIITANVIIGLTVVYLNHWGIIDLGMLIFIMAIIFSVLPEIVFFVKSNRFFW